MFTGLIEAIGTITAVVNRNSSHQITLSAPEFSKDISPGDSIAVNGVCLTAISSSTSSFVIDASPESLRRSNLGNLRSGSKIHLEKALRAGGRLDGHIVQGHVDGMGTLSQLRTEGNSTILAFNCDKDLLSQMVLKGSVAIDGVSLTISALHMSEFEVTLVPFTRQKTLLASKKIGHKVNIETDILGKYVTRWLEQLDSVKTKSGLTMKKLAEFGYGE